MRTACRLPAFLRTRLDNRVTSVTTPEGTINYGYEQSTGRHTETTTSNSDIKYVYDDVGRLWKVNVLKQNGVSTNFTITYLYTPVNNIQYIYYPNGTGDFHEALAALLGPQAPGLSATTVTRLKTVWEDEYQTWNQRSLESKHYVYLWADGVYFNVRLEEDRQCLLVLLGATPDGKKELIAVAAGHRESEQSWLALLLDCKARGMKVDPLLATGDGALGFWKALPQVWSTTRIQRCWVHKTVNVLDKLPKSQHGAAKKMLHNIYLAETRAQAEKAFDLFLEGFGAKHSKATECLAKDRSELLAFYDFPAEHWMHLRSTNPIESVFATVRLRTYRTKGSGSALACETMVFKLMQSAAKRWRALNGSELLAEVIAGVKFVDGIKENAA